MVLSIFGKKHLPDITNQHYGSFREYEPKEVSCATLLPSPSFPAPSSQQQQQQQQQKHQQIKTERKPRQTPTSTLMPKNATNNSYHQQINDTSKGTTYISPRIALPGMAHILSGSVTPQEVQTPPNHSPVLHIVPPKKRQATPKESDDFKKNNSLEEVVVSQHQQQQQQQQQRARRIKGGKQRTRTVPRKGLKANRKSYSGSKESLVLQQSRDSITTNNSGNSNICISQRRDFIEARSRKQQHSELNLLLHKDGKLPTKQKNSNIKRGKKPLPYPINDDVISIIITSSTNGNTTTNNESIAPTIYASTGLVNDEHPDANNSANENEFEYNSEAANENDDEFPEGFEPVLGPLNQSSHNPLVEPVNPRWERRLRYQAPNFHFDTLQQLNIASSLVNVHPPEQDLVGFISHEGITPSLQRSVSQQSNETIYVDAPPIGRAEAVACILERTGSKAQNSRRSHRLREMRQQQNPTTQAILPVTEVSEETPEVPQGLERGEHQQREEYVTSSTSVPLLQRGASFATVRTSLSNFHQQNTNSASTSSHNFQPEPSPEMRASQTRDAIIARLNQRIDPSQYPAPDSLVIEEPPPLDEYAYTDSSDIGDTEVTPPYREKLHKTVDLVSFDPRYNIPVLRVNKRLVKTPKNLRQTIRKLNKMGIVPDEIDLWEINKVDDVDFYQMLPTLLTEAHSRHDAREAIANARAVIRAQREDRRAEYELEIQRALAISIEEQSQRQLFRGFRYNGPLREEREEEDAEGEGLQNGAENNLSQIHSLDQSTDEFVNVDDALSAWQQQQQQQLQLQLQQQPLPQQQLHSHSSLHLRHTRSRVPTIPRSFNYLHPAHTNSSASSYMTAY